MGDPGHVKLFTFDSVVVKVMRKYVMGGIYRSNKAFFLSFY